jgi:hypothetical protein
MIYINSEFLLFGGKMSEPLPPPPPPPQRRVSFSTKKAIIIIAIVSIAVIAGVLAYVFTRPSARLIIDTGYFSVDSNGHTTESFQMQGSEWYIVWADWQGSVTSSSALSIVIHDANTNKIVTSTMLNTTQQTEYFHLKGRYYLTISTDTVGITAHVQVWESQP